MSAITPPTRPDVIEALVSGVDRYNPSNISILEDYLFHQIRSQEYDCMANLAILKLYQFNPELYNPDVVVNILLKALTSAPHADFSLCLALLGERDMYPPPQDEPDVLPYLLPRLTQLSSLLHQCRFPEFWTYLRSNELEVLRDNYTVECVGFEDAIRDVVVRAVRAAFQKIGRDRLSNYLDLEGKLYLFGLSIIEILNHSDIGNALNEYLSALGWQQDLDSKSVIIPPNPDNRIEGTVVRESIQLPQLTKIIAHAQAA